MSEDVSSASLRALGQRVTPARRAVLDVVSGSADHLSAEEIAVAVGERAPNVHRATVFRTLERLVGLGVLVHVHVPHRPTTYHAVVDGDRMHIHLACRGCDRVVDADADVFDDVADALQHRTGFVIDPIHTALSGWCGPCAAALGSGGAVDAQRQR